MLCKHGINTTARLCYDCEFEQAYWRQVEQDEIALLDKSLGVDDDRDEEGDYEMFPM